MQRCERPAPLPRPATAVAYAPATARGTQQVQQPLARDSASAPMVDLGSASPARGGPTAPEPSSAVDGSVPAGGQSPSGGAADHYVRRWQLVEELTCRLVDLSAGPAGPAARSASEVQGRAPATQQAAVLPPGVSVLTFVAAPIKRGIYTPLYVHAHLHALPLRIAVERPAPLAAAVQRRQNEGRNWLTRSVQHNGNVRT